MIESHIKANQFFCPKAFDLSFWGQRDSLDSKILSVKLQTLDTQRAKNYLSNKKFMILLNQEEVRLNKTSEEFYSIQKSSLHWLNASPKQPTTTIFNY